VVEMLRPLLGYARGSGIDARWVVIGGNADFFRVTKRIHNNLHGAEGDGGPLGDVEQEMYESALAENGREFREQLKPGDVVILHDPQTAGLIPAIRDAGVTIIWRCHVGLDNPSDVARRAWQLLIPYVRKADAYVFSREAFRWEGLDDERGTIIAPSIDAFAPKNQDLDEPHVAAILQAAGLVQNGDSSAEPVFVREDGSPGRVQERAEVFETTPLRPDHPVVLQVSRWDRLKDPRGVIQGFADHVAGDTAAHLVYAGPAVEAVSDDPEGKEVLEESKRLWSELPDELQERVHLVCVPMGDTQENAAVINALQRHASVVVQKSLAEGFGLTVAEAMWKGRPVVASGIGGIQDQIEHGRSGLLVKDASDLEEYGAAVRRVLNDGDEAARMGKEARTRVRDEFLGTRSITQYFELFRKLERAQA